MNEPYPDTTGNEIPSHSLIVKSFAFLHALGMRSAPEMLVLELFREYFYEDPRESKFKGINPEEKVDEEYKYSRNVRAVLYALKGRGKTASQKYEGHYFLPAYPSLAKDSWFRRSEASVIYYFFVGGPIANHIWSHCKTDEEKKKTQEEFIKKFYMALVGNNSLDESNPIPENKDFLSAALKDFTAENMKPEHLVKEKLKDHTASKPKGTFLIDNIEDELSKTIFKDLLTLCDLEGELPRMQWLKFFMTFLGFSIPIWALAQMNITNLLHGWLVKAIDSGEIEEPDDIKRQISKRHLGILHPSTTPTTEIFEHVDSYMRKRIELNYILYDLGNIIPEEHINDKRLVIEEKVKGVDLSINRLLKLANEASTGLKSTPHYRKEGVNNYSEVLTRKGEKFKSWLNPRGTDGVASNILEFFNVLYEDTDKEELGGHLLIRHRYGPKIIGFKVFPGQLLLNTITILAGIEKHEKKGGGGQLVLEDIEKHFEKYGIDFGKANDARPTLINQLKAMGLLSGSPDAGGSVAVICPYT